MADQANFQAELFLRDQNYSDYFIGQYGGTPQPVPPQQVNQGIPFNHWNTDQQLQTPQTEQYTQSAPTQHQQQINRPQTTDWFVKYVQKQASKDQVRSLLGKKRQRKADSKERPSDSDYEWQRKIISEVLKSLRDKRRDNDPTPIDLLGLDQIFHESQFKRQRTNEATDLKKGLTNLTTIKHTGNAKQYNTVIIKQLQFIKRSITNNKSSDVQTVYVKQERKDHIKKIKYLERLVEQLQRQIVELTPTNTACNKKCAVCCSNHTHTDQIIQKDKKDEENHDSESESEDEQDHDHDGHGDKGCQAGQNSHGGITILHDSDGFRGGSQDHFDFAQSCIPEYFDRMVGDTEFSSPSQKATSCCHDMEQDICEPEEPPQYCQQCHSVCIKAYTFKCCGCHICNGSDSQCLKEFIEYQLYILKEYDLKCPCGKCNSELESMLNNEQKDALWRNKTLQFTKDVDWTKIRKEIPYYEPDHMTIKKSNQNQDSKEISENVRYTTKEQVLKSDETKYQEIPQTAATPQIQQYDEKDRPGWLSISDRTTKIQAALDQLLTGRTTKPEKAPGKKPTRKVRKNTEEKDYNQSVEAHDDDTQIGPPLNPDSATNLPRQGIFYVLLEKI